MGAFQRGHEALASNDPAKRLHHLAVGCRFKPHAPRFLEVGQDRPDSNVVEARGYRVGIVHQALPVLEEKRLVALRDARMAFPLCQASGVLARLEPKPASFHAHELDAWVVQEARENPGCIRAAANASVDSPWELSRRLEDLRS